MRLIVKEHTEQNISAIPSRLYKVEHFYYSEWVVPRNLYRAKIFRPIIIFLRSPEQKVMQGRNFSVIEILSIIKTKRELANIVRCNFYLVEACQLPQTCTSPKIIPTNKTETKCIFPPCLINKHALPDLRLAFTSSRCYAE